MASALQHVLIWLANKTIFPRQQSCSICHKSGCFHVLEVGIADFRLKCRPFEIASSWISCASTSTSTIVSATLTPKTLGTFDHAGKCDFVFDESTSTQTLASQSILINLVAKTSTQEITKK